VAKEPLEKLEVEWKVLEGQKALVRARGAGRLWVPLEKCP
jgi:hypothetical protein